MITKEMKMEEIIRRFPATLKIFEQYGIDCAKCQLGEYENLEQGARVHNIDIHNILKDLNGAANP
jgi:hybrid cluster-associated redox disulfide protein